METSLSTPPDTNQSQSTMQSKSAQSPQAPAPLVFWLLGILFLPIVLSTLLVAWHNEQILNIFWILLFAHILSFYGRKKETGTSESNQTPAITPSLQWVDISALIGCATLSVVLHQPALGAIGFAFWAYHAVNMFLPAPHARALAVGWLVFLLSPLFYLWLSYPLQNYSANAAHDLLSAFGVKGQVFHDLRGEAHRVLLQVGVRIYHVAAECNGFSLIFCSAITAAWFTLTRSLKTGWVVLAVGLSIPFAFTMNVLRIVTISILTQSSLKHYDLIHEVVGTLTFWLGLAAIFLVLRNQTPGRYVLSNSTPK